jgi:hypothetical protein
MCSHAFKSDTNINQENPSDCYFMIKRYNGKTSAKSKKMSNDTLISRSQSIHHQLEIMLYKLLGEDREQLLFD